jgi:hypothetical protein
MEVLLREKGLCGVSKILLQENDTTQKEAQLTEGLGPV